MSRRASTVSIGPLSGKRQIVWDRLTACLILLNRPTTLPRPVTRGRDSPVDENPYTPGKIHPGNSVPCCCGINLRLLPRDYHRRVSLWGWIGGRIYLVGIINGFAAGEVECLLWEEFLRSRDVHEGLKF